MAYYSVAAYHAAFLPLPKRVEQYRKFEPRIAAYDHYDFYPPKPQGAQLHAIWVVDLITPSQLSIALKKMGKVSWGDSIAINTNPDDWMESTRRLSSGGWRNLGAAAPFGAEYLGSITRFYRFPKSFDFADFRVLSVTPSLSAVVGCFYLKEGQQSAYMSILRGHHFPHGRPNLSGSVSIYDPRAIKKERIQLKRSALRSELSTFMARNFGGFFSSNLPDKLPSVEVLELSLDASHRLKRALFDDFDTWNSKYTGLTWSQAREAPPAHSVLCFTELTYNDFDLESWGGSNPSGLLNRLSFSLPANWTLQSITHLLAAYDGVVTKVRDNEFRPVTSFWRKKELLRNQKTREMMDIRLVTSEICQSEFSWLKSEMLDFSQDRFSSGNAESLKEILIDSIKQRAASVSLHQDNVNSARRDQNENYAMFEMAKMAKYSLLATFISIAIAGYALFVAMGRQP